MTNTTRNQDFLEAKMAKRDEFYTQLSDIERELRHYSRHFEDKVVYCNCDDPRTSNFFRYFSSNFVKLGLKKLITTCYVSQSAGRLSRSDTERAEYLEYQAGRRQEKTLDSERFNIKPLLGDGDFRSSESIGLLKQADIVVTNPPFSLFREYVAQLVEYEKKFLIIGNMNALTYKEIFPLFQENQMWYGPSIRSGDREFGVPDDYPVTAARSRVDELGNTFIRVKGVRWFTNLDYPERHQDLKLHKTFCPNDYPTYANYPAIEVGKTAEIPANYHGPMGVPITFFDKYNPAQFEIIGSSRTLGKRMSEIAERGTYQQGGPRFYLPNDDGTYRRMYDRIVIRNRQL